MRFRKSFSVLARGNACRAAVCLAVGGVGGLRGFIKRGWVMVVLFGFANFSRGLSGLCLFGIARWAAKGVCVDTCELRRLLAVGGVAGLCLLCVTALLRADARLLDAVRLSPFGEFSCICDSLLLYLWLVGFAFSFIVDLCDTGMLAVDLGAVVLRSAMKFVGGSERAESIRLGVVYERTEPFDGDSVPLPAKALPAATCFACCIVRVLTYWRGLEHRRLVAGGLGVGIFVGVARASWSSLTLSVRVLYVDSDSTTDDSDSLLLGRGRKLMVRERDSGFGVGSGFRLFAVLLPSLGVVCCLGEPLDGEAQTADGSLFDSRWRRASRAAVGLFAGGEGPDV